jgi:hypothetical protein
MPVKVKLAGVAVSVAGATPVPDRGRLSVLDPLTASARLPLTAVAVAGVKTTANVLLWFAARVRGRVSPVALKPVPVKVADETVRDVPPEFFIVSVWLWLSPTCTFPKLKLVGVPVRLPAVTAVPARVTLRAGFVALESIVTVPLALPADSGE